MLHDVPIFLLEKEIIIVHSYLLVQIKTFIQRNNDICIVRY